MDRGARTVLELECTSTITCHWVSPALIAHVQSSSKNREQRVWPVESACCPSTGGEVQEHGRGTELGRLLLALIAHSPSGCDGAGAARWGCWLPPGPQWGLCFSTLGFVPII